MRWMLLATLGLFSVAPALAQEAPPPPGEQLEEMEEVEEGEVEDEPGHEERRSYGDWQSYAPPVEQAAPVGEDEAGPPLDEATYRATLDPYGHWEHQPPYGWVWIPHSSVVGVGWSPYTRGHWVYTRHGWSWVSDFRWGWVPFHYGRWHLVHGRWAWIPGRDWAPAWVAWRSDDDVVGWAPLPWGVSIGASLELGPHGWSFVPVAYFGAPVLTSYYVPAPRVRYYYGRTRPVVVVRHYHRGGRVWYAGPKRTWVSSRWGRPVPVVRHVPAHRHSRYEPGRSHRPAPPAYHQASPRRHQYTPPPLRRRQHAPAPAPHGHGKPPRQRGGQGHRHR
ncbi:MAG: hypothetical protein FJ125_14335 [Deltaproteobacteria bacterium]|nr:hypothetical protein [Deltaproteobacteria bacterium]